MKKNNTRQNVVQGYERLTPEEIRYACEVIGEDLGGAAITGWLIALFQHVLAVSLSKQDVEVAVTDIANQLFLASDWTIDPARDQLVNRSLNKLRKSVTELRSERLADLTQEVSHASN